MTQKTAKLYQLAPEKNSLMTCYVLVTSENKLIVFDGGIDGYGKENTPYLPAALRAILGLPEDGYFEVEAWFLSHGHTDHIYELAKMLKSYTKDSAYRINHLYFNFPAFGTEWKSGGGEGDYSLAAIDALREGLDNYARVNGLSGWDYDSVNGAVITPDAIRAGLTFSYDGCFIDVLQTWAPEDRIVNSNSTILRLRVGEHSVLFLGDAYTDSGDRLLAAYGADALKSEYVQLAHHGQHVCSKEFYLSVGTDKAVRLWHSPVWVWSVYRHGAIVTDETRSWFGLPEKPEDYFAAGCDRTGRDLVAGLYSAYPENPTKVSDWTKEILEEQCAAVFAE